MWSYLETLVYSQIFWELMFGSVPFLALGSQIRVWFLPILTLSTQYSPALKNSLWLCSPFSSPSLTPPWQTSFQLFVTSDWRHLQTVLHLQKRLILRTFQSWRPAVVVLEHMRVLQTCLISIGQTLDCLIALVSVSRSVKFFLSVLNFPLVWWAVRWRVV